MKNYLVGGAVRDSLLGYPFHERDWVVVGATPQQMSNLGFRPVGKDFPVFLHPETNEEYALARTERKSGVGYHGFSFNCSTDVSLEEDLLRRDLTINAMARDTDGTIIDPYGGEKDLASRTLKHVSEAFSEDPLRVLRVARFLARYSHLGFTIHPSTLELMRQLSSNNELTALSSERVWLETQKALTEQTPSAYFASLHSVNADIKLFGQPLVLDNLTVLDRETQPLIRWALLAIMGNEQLTNLKGIPNEYSKIAKVAIAYDKAAKIKLDGPLVLATLEQFNALRDSKGRELLCALSPYIPDSPSEQQINELCAQINKLTAATFIAEGKTGPQIGAAMKEARIDIIKNHLELS